MGVLKKYGDGLRQYDADTLCFPVAQDARDRIRRVAHFPRNDHDPFTGLRRNTSRIVERKRNSSFGNTRFYRNVFYRDSHWYSLLPAFIVLIIRFSRKQYSKTAVNWLLRKKWVEIMAERFCGLKDGSIEKAESKKKPGKRRVSSGNYREALKLKSQRRFRGV